jgi:uncharacterized membrane protein
MDVDHKAVTNLVIGLAISIGVFFLGSYLLQLTYNASLPKLLTNAQAQDNYWVFVLLAIFVSIIGMFLSPSFGFFGLINRPRAFRKLMRF